MFCQVAIKFKIETRHPGPGGGMGFSVTLIRFNSRSDISWQFPKLKAQTAQWPSSRPILSVLEPWNPSIDKYYGIHRGYEERFGRVVQEIVRSVRGEFMNQRGLIPTREGKCQGQSAIAFCPTDPFSFWALQPVDLQFLTYRSSIVGFQD